MAGLFDTLIEGGLSLYDKYKGRENMPINERTFLETTLDKNKEPITEKNLTKAELKELYDLIYSQYTPYTNELTKYKEYIVDSLNQAKNKKITLSPGFKEQFEYDLKAITDFENKKITPELFNLMTGERSAIRGNAMLDAAVKGKTKYFAPLSTAIRYENYPTEEGQMNRSLGSGETSEGKLATFLGQFNYGVNPKTGSLYVKDTYDFNPSVNRYTGQQQQAYGDVKASEAPGNLPYNILRAYAGRTIPPGSGREVLINLNYQDPFGDTTK